MATFNWNTYKDDLKSKTETVGKKLSESYMTGSYPVNQAELVCLDFVPSSGSLYCCELNSCIMISEPQAIGQTGFNFDAVSSFVSSSGYHTIKYVHDSSDEVYMDSETEWITAASQSAVDYGLGVEQLYQFTLAGNYWNVDTGSYYVVNIPPDRNGILSISRDKSEFRTWMTNNSLGSYLTPTATESLANNLNGNSLPDVVAKDPGLDNRKGLSFYTLTDDNRESIFSQSLVEQIMPSDTTSTGYPVNCRGQGMVYHQDLNTDGFVWLRPPGSENYWANDTKYIASGSDQFKFKPTGVFGHFKANTQVYLHDGSTENIQDITSGQYVKTGYWSGEVEGKMQPTLVDDDKISVEGKNEAWRSFATTSLDTLTVASASVKDVTFFGYSKSVKINNHLEVSPIEFLFAKSGSSYSFVKSQNLTTDHKLIKHDKSEIDITSIEIESGSMTNFYALDMDGQDTYFVSESLFVGQHWLP
jgi:hypothetical protein